MSMTYYAVTDDPNELAHYGILGMKWGVVHDNPRHKGSRGKQRSPAYKKAQSKLGKMMKSGIKKAEAKWKAYNSPKAKEERFMKKAMEQARTGTLKYGKLTDAQVQKVTDRLYLEQNARRLGSTENPKFLKRLTSSFGQGVVSGVGQGVGSYINERFKGRGATTAAMKAEKRMAKFHQNETLMRQKAANKIAEEYYNTALEEGDNPYKYSGTRARAKYLADVKARNKADEYQHAVNRTYAEQGAKAKAIDDTKKTVLVLDPVTGRATFKTKYDIIEYNNRPKRPRRFGHS